MGEHPGWSPLVFILSWERPLYLWACLDSLHRHTRAPCRFVLIDNASTDPLVHQVIQGFEARGMFHRVHRQTENKPESLMQVIDTYAGHIGSHFAYIESDVVVLPAERCWLTQFMDLAAGDTKLALMGSLVDKSDFIDPAWASRAFPELKPEQLDFLIKVKSPERNLHDHYDEPLIDPFNPPGRLQYVMRSLIDEVGFLQDRLLYQSCKQRGYRAGIATGVRHRHLSFQNLFDYPETDVAQRNAFFKGFGKDSRK